MLDFCRLISWRKYIEFLALGFGVKIRVGLHLLRVQHPPTTINFGELLGSGVWVRDFRFGGFVASRSIGDGRGAGWPDGGGGARADGEAVGTPSAAGGEGPPDGWGRWRGR